jgi:hypothetical protein
MATRKRKQDEELVALPSDESEEEEEYVCLLFAHPLCLWSLCVCRMVNRRSIEDGRASSDAQLSGFPPFSLIALGFAGAHWMRR